MRRRSDKRRIGPVLVTYDPTAYVIPIEERPRLCGRYSAQFSNEDFAEMAEAFAVCEAFYDHIQSAALRGEVKTKLEKIAELSASLHRLLAPESGIPIDPPRPNANDMISAKDAVSRLRYTLVREAIQTEEGVSEELHLRRRPEHDHDFLDQLLPLLGLLETGAKKASEA